jgi:hypothetical protein
LPVRLFWTLAIETGLSKTLSITLKLIRAVLVLLNLPGAFITLHAGAVVANLLWDEFFPDPANIAHGMAMAHGFIAMLAWAILGLLYLVFLRVPALVARRIGRPRDLEIKNKLIFWVA